MRSSPFRTLLAFLVLGLMLAPEGLLLHRCACGKVWNCCCRSGMQSCRLRYGPSHCEGGSRQDTPSSLRSRQEPVDRFGAALAALPALRLACAGRVPASPRRALSSLFPRPPVPPPRCPALA